MAFEELVKKESTISQQSTQTDTTDNSVPTGTNNSAITAEGNFGVTPATSDQDSAIPAAKTDMSATTPADDTQASSNIPATSNPLAPSASDSLHMAKFKLAVLAALDNTDFTGDIKKVEKATQAVTLPNPEDRVRAQLLSNAEKTLYAKAAKDAERGLPFVLPTKADINAHVEHGIKAYREKQATL